MSARFIILDGHIPTVFPGSVRHTSVSHAMIDHSIAARCTAYGECFYDSARGWYCRTYVEDVGWVEDKASAELLNRHLCI